MNNDGVRCVSGEKKRRKIWETWAGKGKIGKGSDRIRGVDVALEPNFLPALCWCVHFSFFFFAASQRRIRYFLGGFCDILENFNREIMEYFTYFFFCIRDFAMRNFLNYILRYWVFYFTLIAKVCRNYIVYNAISFICFR